MTSEDESPEAMLQQIFSLAQKYSKCSANRLMVKCKTPEGGLIFAFNTGTSVGSGNSTRSSPVSRPSSRPAPVPSSRLTAAPVSSGRPVSAQSSRSSAPEPAKTANFPKTPTKAPRIFSDTSASEASTADEFYMFEESSSEEAEDTKSLRDRVRVMCLEQARKDLFMPDLKNLPWSRLIAPGWPQGAPFGLDHPSPSVEQFNEIRRRLEAGEIQFFWK